MNTVEWNDNGRWVLTASQDNLLRLWDVRRLEKPLRKMRGHDCAVTSAKWHPHHRELFASADYHGGLKFWLASLDEPIASVANSKFEGGAGHESGVFAMAWHPMGHMLATGSNDNFTKFWTRPRPGEKTEFKGATGSAGGETVRATQVRRPPPDNYTCRACNIKGHWIQQWCVKGWRRGIEGRCFLLGPPISNININIPHLLPSFLPSCSLSLFSLSLSLSPSFLARPCSTKKNSHFGGSRGSSSGGGGQRSSRPSRPPFQPPPPPNPMGVGQKRSRFGNVGQV